MTIAIELVSTVVTAALRWRALSPWGSSDISTEAVRYRPAEKTTPSSRIMNAPSMVENSRMLSYRAGLRILRLFSGTVENGFSTHFKN